MKFVTSHKTTVNLDALTLFSISIKDLPTYFVEDDNDVRFFIRQRISGQNRKLSIFA